MVIRTNQQKYNQKIKFIRGNPTKDSIAFAQAYWNVDISKMISARELIRFLRAKKAQRATNLISEDGKITKLWHQK